MREDVACRDQIQARITLEKSIGGVLGEGRIEIEWLDERTALRRDRPGADDE